MEQHNDGDWAGIYHLFMSAYGWTIEEVDNLTVRQMMVLLKEIRKYPPVNVLVAELLKGLGDKSKGADPLNTDKQLSKIPHTVKGPEMNPVKSIFSKSGNKILKVVEKRTGKRIM